MKQKITLLSRFFFSFCLTGVFTLGLHAQSVKRQSIGSYGATVTTEKVTFYQTAGQPYHTAASHDPNNSVLPGFQQPHIFAVERMANDEDYALNLQIYPNPALYEVHIQTESVIPNSVIQITDVTGKLIYTEIVPSLQQHTLHCESWENGIYLLKVTGADLKTSSSKLIIHK